MLKLIKQTMNILKCVPTYFEIVYLIGKNLTS